MANKAKITLTILETQKKVFERLQAQLVISKGEKTTIIEMFGRLLESHQAHMGCEEKKEIDKLLAHKKADQLVTP